MNKILLWILAAALVGAVISFFVQRTTIVELKSELSEIELQRQIDSLEIEKIIHQRDTLLVHFNVVTTRLRDTTFLLRRLTLTQQRAVQWWISKAKLLDSLLQQADTSGLTFPGEIFYYTAIDSPFVSWNDSVRAMVISTGEFHIPEFQFKNVSTALLDVPPLIVEKIVTRDTVFSVEGLDWKWIPAAIGVGVVTGILLNK